MKQNINHYGLWPSKKAIRELNRARRRCRREAMGSYKIKLWL